MEGENGRVRAWVLVKGDNADAISDQLADKYRDTRDEGTKDEHDVEFGAGGDELVVVRADVVEGQMNLVVPVDAASEEILKRFVADVQEMDPEAEILVLSVRRHDPMPPHRSSTYVTTAELWLHPHPASTR